MKQTNALIMTADCQTATGSCAGTAKKDGQKDAFVYLPKGACAKIVGGSLEAGKA